MTHKLTTLRTDVALLFGMLGLHIFNMVCWALEVMMQGGGRGLG